MRVNLVVDSSKKITGLSNYGAALLFELTRNIVVNTINKKILIPHFILIVIKLIFGIDLKTILQHNPIYLPLPRKGISHLTSQEQTICLNYLKRKAVVTVHDIIPLATNTYNSFFAKIIYLLAMRGLKHTEFIIAVSEHTKKDIIKYLNYPTRKIKVIPQGVDHSYFKPAKIKRDEFTILYVGSEMPRKNVLTLFKAFAIIKQEIPEAKLVKVGLSQWQGARNKLVKFVKANNLESSVIFKDYVQNLNEEYQNATIFVFPSKYEGFGFPPLEAMACGCPVICSNATSLPEVVGDSAFLFNPNDVQELSEKITTLLKSSELREKYSAKGIKQSKQFTWEKCLKETIEVYKRLLQV